MWTLGGLVDVFVLFFVHLGSRRVHLAGLTAHPDKAWMVQQVRNVSMFFAEQSVRPTILLRDHDSKFVHEFDAILQLDRFLVFGEAHLQHIVSCYVDYHNTCRPHQSMDNRPLTGLPPPELVEDLCLEDIVCEERLGGLLKHYRRRAQGLGSNGTGTTAYRGQ